MQLSDSNPFVIQSSPNPLNHHMCEPQEPLENSRSTRNLMMHRIYASFRRYVQTADPGIDIV
jgi:hypothetical protein